uniref:Uncharacterized protein n=1 Tax=Cucumis melo TaxID=3656 RepID=A0A9I9DYE8_CUCME
MIARGWRLLQLRGEHAGCGSVLRRRMDGATSSMRMGDRNGSGWVRGDATTTVGASWTNTDWSRHNPLASDSDVAT